MLTLQTASTMLTPATAPTVLSRSVVFFSAFYPTNKTIALAILLVSSRRKHSKFVSYTRYHRYLTPTTIQFFEGTYAPPLYTDLYNFKDGAQNDIFGESAVETTGWVSATANAKRAPEPTPAAGPRRLLSRHAKKQGHGVF